MSEVKKIFIVEDEVILRDALAQKLRTEGFAVSSAADGAEGLRMITEEKPDLVLLDVMLPGMDGFTVLENLRADPRTRDIAVIIISNSGQPVEIERALKLGANDYLIKAQFDPIEVIEKVNAVFGTQSKTDSTPATLPDREQNDTIPQSTEGALRILIVEDDKFLRQLLFKKFTNNGFAANEAIDGNEALALLRKDAPHIVLLDLILPGIDGFEVLRQMRSTPAFSKIPVIILSNLGQAEDMRRARDLGANDYMVKANFSLDEIVTRVRTIAQEHYVDLR